MISTISYSTSAVGSFPQPVELRKLRVALRRETVADHQLAYQTSLNDHLKKWLDFQEEIGLDWTVSGEFERGDMAEHFGLAYGGRLTDFVPSYENRCYRPVEYFTAITNRQVPVTLSEFSTAQNLSHRPLKHTLTGPATLAAWALLRHPPYYHDRVLLRQDLAAVIRQEISALKAAGARIIQIDEPALTTNMANLGMDCQAIIKTIENIPDIYFVLHLCYSDKEALDKAFPAILSLPFQQIHLEMANRRYALLSLIQKHGFGGKDVGLGVIDVHTNRLETVDEITTGVAQVRQLLPAEQIHLLPDCGLKERREEVAKAKMRILVEAAKVCREKLA